jgi:ribosomal protein L6P/L9E
MSYLRLPKDINLNILKGKNKKVIQIKTKRTSLWFLVEDNNLELSSRRVIKGNKGTIRLIEKGLISLKVGCKRTLILLGVGFKGSLLEEKSINYLELKQSSSKPPLYVIPKDVSVIINRQRISC